MCKDMEITYDEEYPDDTQVPNMVISIPLMNGKFFFHCEVQAFQPEATALSGNCIQLFYDDQPQGGQIIMIDDEGAGVLSSGTYTATDILHFNVAAISYTISENKELSILAGYYVLYYNGSCEVHSLTESVTIPGTNTTTTMLNLIKGMYTLTVYAGYYKEGSN